MSSMEKEIIALLEENGPQTGQELLRAAGGDGLLLWRTCKGSEDLDIHILGTRYLRFDREVEGYARLSPSILREFLTYSVVGLRRDPAPILERAERLLNHIQEVSRAKSGLAHDVVSSLCSRFENEGPLTDRICFILAGDIVYNMAHDIPRPERSTGKRVNGSDMDIVVIVDDLFPKTLMERLDDAIYQEKIRLLITPHLREEIDYIVKDLDRVREQVRFDTFKRMVACKILHEGTMIYGSEELFHRVKGLLREHGVADRIEAMEREARLFRDRAEEILLRENIDKIKRDRLVLFYPAEESEEFE
jgi:hypothetical protein